MTINNEHKKLNFSSEREQSQACLNSAEHEKNQGRKVLNVPNLRFPEFQGEWITYKIKDVLSIGNGRDYKHLSNGEIPVFGTGGYMTSVDECLYDGETTFIGRKGSINKPFYYNGKFWTVDTLFYTHSFNGITPKFTYCLFQTINWLKYNEASGVPSLSKDTIEKIKIKIPGLEEQNKIAKLMFALDERIATQNKIIEDLKKLKCAIIEKVYSEIQGKEYSYGQLFDVVNERNKQMEYSNILSASQEKGMVNRDDLNLDIQFERSNINTYKIVKKGDYVIHLRSFQGGFAFSDKLGVCSPAYTILRPNSILEYGYLSNYFTSQRFIKSLVLVTYGIRDGRSINVDEWLRMKITIPPKEHQQYIVEVIGTFERKIEDEEAYAAQLSIQKQYLLRQMFV